ncbi:hypothetical protein G6F43_007194 [Rhizopus delemar]|nr:hypothetical protein G6F43_007194 [Rhizopus delemar]
MGNQTSRVLSHKKKYEGSKSSSNTSNAGSRRGSITDCFIKQNQNLVPVKNEEEIKEKDRYQRMHYMLKLVNKRNILTTFNQSPSIIVKSGLDDGIWTIEVATEYPDAKIIGLDTKLPDIQLPNQTYYRTDIVHTWPIPANTVDFVYQRNMGTRLQKEHWPIVLRQMFTVLKKGACIELVEHELFNHQLGPVSTEIREHYRDQCKQQNLALDPQQIPILLNQIGFEGIECKVIDVPLGEWPDETELKHFGFMNLDIQKAQFKNKKNEFMSNWGLTSTAYDQMMSQAVEEIERYRSFTRFNCWMAKKPLL